MLCGCSDYREIERGYLVSAIGVNKTSDSVEIYLETQTAALSDKTLERAVLNSNGNTLNNAFENLKLSLVKPLYFEQVAVVIFNSPLTVEDINFLTQILKLNYGAYIVNTADITSLFAYESPSEILGYDIITLIKNFEKEQKLNSRSRLFEVLKNNHSLSAVNIDRDKLVFILNEE